MTEFLLYLDSGGWLDKLRAKARRGMQVVVQRSRTTTGRWKTELLEIVKDSKKPEDKIYRFKGYVDI